MNQHDRAALAIHGNIDRRDRAALHEGERPDAAAAMTKDERRCSGCAATSCPCARSSTASSRRPETLRQARDWQKTKDHYLLDGFCDTCSVQAAFGHQIGFSQVAHVCTGCRGKRPTYRWAGEQAHRWSGVTAARSPRPMEAA